MNGRRGRKRPLAFLPWASGPIRDRLRLFLVWAREPEVAWALSGVRRVEHAGGGAFRARPWIDPFDARREARPVRRSGSGAGCSAWDRNRRARPCAWRWLGPGFPGADWRVARYR